ncbi:MAG: tRNA epoxyqueuosine(34) reductase QueG [Bacteroidales bacterium]|nr:tRNA epoxyqueuosine(34) reductase QueG [Bacteroidales bacterium]
METPKEYNQLIREKALELGFSDCGFSPASTGQQDISILEKWIDNGMQAGMDWMHRGKEIRKDPQKLVPNAQTVISVLLNYYTSRMQDDPDAPVISKYAYGRDYHKVLKKKLKALLDYVKELLPGTTGRAFVDSAPVMEHAFARNAGMGWIGKNSLLISPSFGSFIFLGEIITDAIIEADRPEISDMCGNCSLCIDECPTHAIQLGRIVDARKCISYLTIEHKGNIPEEYRNNFYNRVFGCDICQEVCPWNRKAEEHTVPDFYPSEELMTFSKKEWIKMDETTFETLFRGTPVMRGKYDGLKRNVEYLSLE